MKQLLEVSNLAVNILDRDQKIRVVSDVSFCLRAGETLTIIGESGCGKTTLALAIIGLARTGSKISIGGSIHFDGTELVGAESTTLQAIRGKSIAFVSQNPQTSFDPILTIGRQMCEVLKLHTQYPASEYTDRIISALHRVGIAVPKSRIDDYPHQFSGGMLQRVMLATALLASPQLLIADEPTSALDVTVQAQILELLLSIQAEQKMSILMITHDIGVASRMSDHISVMYAGRFVESGPNRSVLLSPSMPYTQGLIAATPRYKGLNPRRVSSIPGAPPVFGIRQIEGCSFYERCVHHQEICTTSRPLLRFSDDEHEVACHFDIVTNSGTA